ncbi:MAG: leucine-rich repeat protein [Alistipes sp.]|nr:leucine-rich repeat protein [Alistipes sp.]
MKKLLRYLPLLTLALIASCTTIDEGMDKTEVLQVSTNKMEIESLSSKETFTITSYCDWLAVITYEDNDSNWINLSSTKGSRGTKDVTVTFDENKALDDRYATITVINSRYDLSQEIKIHQKAFEPYIELDTETITSIASGTTKSITLESTISWKASCDADWITITPASGKKGTSTLKVVVTQNTKTVVRESVVKVFNAEYNIEKQIAVTQDLNENANRMIVYTSSNNNIILPPGLGLGDDRTVFGAEIIENKYINGSGVILFDGEVTTIGEWAFAQCDNLTSITIPDSVTTIGECAFQGCSSLTSVAIGDSITTIGERAFMDCSSLTSVTIGDSVTTIGWCAFMDCSSLTSITIPDSVTTIDEGAFYNCSSLKNVYCKATTPPEGGYDMFYNNAYGRKIYVPTESVKAYKSAWYWWDYESDIVGYDF